MAQGVLLGYGAFGKPAEFLLAHGKHWNERRRNTPHGRHNAYFRHNACFRNAFRLARRRKDLRYAEGFAWCVTPHAHAWCIDPQDRVIDPTWEYPLCPMDCECQKAPDYFGIVLNLDAVRCFRRLTQNNSVLFSWGLRPEFEQILSGQLLPQEIRTRLPQRGDAGAMHPDTEGNKNALMLL
jgi:hypothetical protein